MIMATLTADRHLAQRSLLDPHEEDRPLRAPHPQAPDQPRPSRPPELDRGRPAPHPARTGRAAAPSGPTLDDLVAGTWDALTVAHAAPCPVCGDDLTPRFSSGPIPVAAGCRSCGSQLS